MALFTEYLFTRTLFTRPGYANYTLDKILDL